MDQAVGMTEEEMRPSITVGDVREIIEDLDLDEDAPVLTIDRLSLGCDDGTFALVECVSAEAAGQVVCGPGPSTTSSSCM